MTVASPGQARRGSRQGSVGAAVAVALKVGRSMNLAPTRVRDAREASTGLRYRYVCPVISPRARGLSVRLNLNPDGRCNFDCLYCDVRRSGLSGRPGCPDLEEMAQELEEVLELIRSGEAHRLQGCGSAPREFLGLGHVALSGDGEPTLCPGFDRVVEQVLHLRAQGGHGFFKVALITNGTGFDLPEVRRGLALLTPQDEIWTKLDAGSDAWFRRVNRPGEDFARVLDAMLRVGRTRPLVIQSLFPRLEGRPMPLAEQDAYARRLRMLVDDGVQIRMVQVYSASRTPARSGCGHASLAELSGIARRVREVVGVPAQVF